MKKRLAIINFGLAIAVLFSMLFQSYHSFEHLEKEFSEKLCHHQYHSPSEITHQHHNFDHCFICEFTFANFIAPKAYSFQSQTVQWAIPYFFTAPKIPESFPGSSYSLRGPPNFIA